MNELKIYKDTKILALFFAFLFIACNNKELPKGDWLLNKAVEAHGGIENWNSIRAFSYEKRILLKRDDGTVESDITQHILYDFDSVFSGKMWWAENNQMHRIVFDGHNAIKTVDSLPAGDSSAAKSAFMASWVTFSQPFKLLTDRVRLKTESEVVLDNGRKTYKVRVIYPEETTADSDRWWYFFDAETHLVAANLVYHNGRYSFIENTAYDRTTPFVLNAQRESFFTDSLLNKKYLRASYELTNLQVALD